MTVSVVVPQAMAEELESVANLSKETAGVMLAAVAEAPNGDIRLLARRMRWVEEDAYSRREWNGLTIRSEGYIQALSEPESIGATCIWVHTHPGQDASPRDATPDHGRGRHSQPTRSSRTCTAHDERRGRYGSLYRKNHLTPVRDFRFTSHQALGTSSLSHRKPE